MEAVAKHSACLFSYVYLPVLECLLFYSITGFLKLKEVLEIDAYIAVMYCQATVGRLLFSHNTGVESRG